MKWLGIQRQLRFALDKALTQLPMRATSSSIFLIFPQLSGSIITLYQKTISHLHGSRIVGIFGRKIRKMTLLSCHQARTLSKLIYSHSGRSRESKFCMVREISNFPLLQAFQGLKPTQRNTQWNHVIKRSTNPKLSCLLS